MSKRPTEEAYQELQTAFDFFNQELFEGRLPPCLITLQRHKRSKGYFSTKRFVRHSGGQYTHELAMNPEYFASQPLENTLSTLCHEMTHLEQSVFGKPGRRGYHNKEWGGLMKRIGLHPSATGLPGGEETGERMTHFIVEDGPFIQACRRLLATNFVLSWHDRWAIPVPPPMPAPAVTPGDAPLPRVAQPLTRAPIESANLDVQLITLEPDRSNRHKYACPSCHPKDATSVWGRPGLHVVCGKCQVRLEEFQ